MTRAALSLSGVACVRGGRMVFAGIDLALGPGDAAIVTGPNGAGKSSLIRIAAGLLAPAAGTVRTEGARALLSEECALDSEMPLARALRFWTRIDGTPKAAGKGPPIDRDPATLALAAMGLAQLAQVPVRMLSAGQRRRAGMAAVLARGAALWLLDEPANGLDAASLALLERALARHRATGGIVLATTHVPLHLPDATPVELKG